MNKKIFWFDVETSGLNPIKNDIISLAYIIEINGQEKAEGEFFIQPFNWADMGDKALEINGFTREQLKTFETPKEVYKKIVKLLDRYIDKYNKQDKFHLAGYNVKFDVDFFKQFFIKNGDKYFGSYFNYRVLDVMCALFIEDYKKSLEIENFKLETASKKFGIEINAHDAKADIRVTKNLFEKLVGKE